jgi:hypothetical protein
LERIERLLERRFDSAEPDELEVASGNGSEAI